LLLTLEAGPSPRMIRCGIARRRRLESCRHTDGSGEELSLEPVEFAFERDEVELFVLGGESMLDLLRQLGMVKEAAIGGFRIIVASRQLATGSDFFFELHDRLEEVGVNSQGLVELVQETQLRWGIVAVVTNGFADDGVVFLFDEAVVVLAIGATPGEGDAFSFTVAIELVVDKLRAVIGVDAQKGKRQCGPDLFQGLEDIALGLIFHGACFGPPRGDIGEIQRLDIVTEGTTTVVGHQVDFTEARALIVPVGESLDGDMVFQERSWPGCAATLEPCLRLSLCQQPIERCCTDRQQLLSYGVVGNAK